MSDVQGATDVIQIIINDKISRKSYGLEVSANESLQNLLDRLTAKFKNVVVCVDHSGSNLLQTSAADREKSLYSFGIYEQSALDIYPDKQVAGGNCI